MNPRDALWRMRNSLDDMWSVQQYNLKPDEKLESNLVFAMNVMRALEQMIDWEGIDETDSNRGN